MKLGKPKSYMIHSQSQNFYIVAHDKCEVLLVAFPPKGDTTKVEVRIITDSRVMTYEKRVFLNTLGAPCAPYTAACAALERVVCDPTHLQPIMDEITEALRAESGT